MASTANNEDPLVRHARREALAIVAIWATALVYCITYCASYGYDSTAPLTFVLGVPSWVFWGIVVPWGVCTLLAITFSLFIIRDDPLGAEAENPDEPEHVDA